MEKLQNYLTNLYTKNQQLFSNSNQDPLKIQSIQMTINSNSKIDFQFNQQSEPNSRRLDFRGRSNSPNRSNQGKLNSNQNRVQEVNQNHDDDYKYFISTKVVMLGESSVGKSSLVQQFMLNRFMPGFQEPTVSPHFVKKIQTIYKLGQQKVQFNIWDTAGQEKYRCLTTMYFRDANVAIIVYDVTNKQSLECVDYWVDEVNRSNANDYFIVLVGNKCDLRKFRQVTMEEGQAKAKQIGAQIYYECSASNEKSVQNLFQEIGIYLYKLQEEYDVIIPEEHLDIDEQLLSKRIDFRMNKFKAKTLIKKNSIKINSINHSKKHSQSDVLTNDHSFIEVDKEQQSKCCN
ncbi:gtp binding protein [Stylonychia lemnae]|uniref:Gtp binding protein n=1 Tax=Stylonychia lemnae TaxID=5949 RepID=A0A078AV81_STYLE|nr:gtp binding protein [Stylonychia lemnae]|eukprot:CDW84763.1 gtp binding protein [Stylonychia lemnae]